MTVGDRVEITLEGHTFEGVAGIIGMIEPDIRGALVTDDLLHLTLDTGHDIRIFSRYVQKLPADNISSSSACCFS